VSRKTVTNSMCFTLKCARLLLSHGSQRICRM